MPFRDHDQITDPESISLSVALDGVFLRASAELNTILQNIAANESLTRADLKTLDRCFTEINQLLSRIRLKKITGVLSEEHLGDYISSVEELSDIYQSVVDAVEAQNPASRDPKNMTIEEVDEILERLVDDSAEYYREANQRWLELSKGNVLEEARYRCRRAFQKVLAAGDTGEKDFSVGWDEITQQLVNKTTNFIDIGRYLFVVADQDVRKAATAKEADNELPINELAIEMFEYMKARIKGEHGGITSDPALHGDADFSYNSLSGEVIGTFIAHLRDKFGGDNGLDPEIFEQMLKFAQGVGPVKDCGYVAKLLKEVTRSHGTGYYKLHGLKFADPLFVTAPIQAGAYSRGRYGAILPNSTSPDMVMLSEQMAMDLVPENHDGSLNHLKRESSRALHKIVNLFYRLMWRGEPSFLKDMRGLFGIGEGEIDLYESIFPFPGEVVVNAYKVELEKRELIRRHDEEITTLMTERSQLNSRRADLSDIDNRIAVARANAATKKKEFIEKWSKFGYGSSLSEIGVARLAKDPEGKSGYGLSISQYDTSFKAMDEMREFFHNPISSGQMTFQECTDKWTYWMQSIIGKAKLIPGKHFLLFPFYTMLAALKIVSGYEYRNKAQKVNELLEKMLLELEQAGGVPSYVKKEVLKYIRADKKHFGVWTVAIDSEHYVGELYRYKKRFSSDLVSRLRGAFPLNWFKVDDDGTQMKVEPPWAWSVKADKNTSNK